MDELHNRNNRELIRTDHCRDQNVNNNNSAPTAYTDLDNRREDPLGEPEVTVHINERFVMLPIQPAEELEDDLFDDEGDVITQEGNTDSEEQVVPSSQMSNSHKYPEELTISDDEIDEGIFEEDQNSFSIPEVTETDDNHRHDSQPP